MSQVDFDSLSEIVAQHLYIHDITRGDAGSQYIARYRGQLIHQDSDAAYQQLASQLDPINITPLFQLEGDQHVIKLISGISNPKPSRTWINGLLFVLTIGSVFFAGVYYTLGSVYQGPPNPGLSDLVPSIKASLGGGLAFTVSLLAILLAHEFGHYLAGRYHRAHVTLPYFLPFPFSAFGTMGAFIQMKAPPRNRRILMDIGIAGPLAGLVVAVPVLLIGLHLSETSTLPSSLQAGQGLQIEGNSILYLFAKYIVFGKLLPAPGSYGDISVWQYWLKYFFTGRPLPMGGEDVLLSPVAWAGWAGLLVTALNLIPAGQLDGGHLLYVLMGKKSSLLLPVILGILILLGFVWPGWWLWALLIFMLGRNHAEVLDQITPLDANRKALAVLGLVVFVLVFTPVPLLAVGI